MSAFRSPPSANNPERAPCFTPTDGAARRGPLQPAENRDPFLLISPHSTPEHALARGGRNLASPHLLNREGCTGWPASGPRSAYAGGSWPPLPSSHLLARHSSPPSVIPALYRHSRPLPSFQRRLESRGRVAGWGAPCPAQAWTAPPCRPGCAKVRQSGPRHSCRGPEPGPVPRRCPAMAVRRRRPAYAPPPRPRKGRVSPPPRRSCGGRNLASLPPPLMVSLSNHPRLSAREGWNPGA